MQIKKGVIIAGLQPVMRPALMGADLIWTDAGQELVVTCGLDGTHWAGSKHYYGLALDFRSRYFSEDDASDEKAEVFARLEKQLGSSFKCVWHKTHIHVEWAGLM